LDRWNNHFKREKASDDKPTMVNRNESLSQSSNHASTGSNRERSSDETPAMVKRTEPCSQSSNHASRNKSNDSLGTGVSSSRRVLLRKSSLNEKLSHSVSTFDEPVVRRVQHRRASLGGRICDSVRPFEKHHDSSDEKEKPHRLRRSGSINEKDPHKTTESHSRLRRSGSINEKDPQKTTVNPRKPPERHKSSDNVLCQGSTDKLAEFRQLQRKKTMNGIFGSDWKNDSTNTTNVPSDLMERPEPRRCKSDDLMDLRKALADVYSGKVTN
jgi:hypothetical protein